MSKRKEFWKPAGGLMNRHLAKRPAERAASGTSTGKLAADGDQARGEGLIFSLICLSYKQV
jgi:hypothetical protein